MGNWWRRLVYLVRSSRQDADLHDEIEAHRAMRAEQLERDGLTPQEATAGSRRALGNVLLAREDVREIWLGSWATWMQDIQYGLRTLRHSPGFTASAVITLALGIGVNAGLFTVINALVFREPSAPDSHELVSIAQVITSDKGVTVSNGGSMSTSEYNAYRDGTRTLSGLMAFGNSPETTLGGDTPKVLLGATVSCNYFDVLRQPPALGRGLAARDCEAGAPPVVVLNHELWATVFASDPGIVGRSVVLNRHPFSVVGVGAKGAYSLAPFGVLLAGYIAPLSTEPLLRSGASRYADDNQKWLSLVGRRSGGVELEQVRAEFNVLADRLNQQTPGVSRSPVVERLTTVPAGAEAGAAVAAATLMGAFGCILLIACANVANLLLARGTGRSQEIAIRAALGASRGRVIHQLLAESLLLAGAGGILGSVVAVWSFQGLVVAAIPAVIPPGLPFSISVDLRPDVQVVSFAVVLTVLTALLFGLMPALHVSNANLHAVMTHDSSGGGGSRRAGRLRGALVGVQVALCMTLTIAAGLLLRGLYATHTVDPGFSYRDVAYVSLESAFALAEEQERIALSDRLAAAVAALPGVTAIAFTDQEPLGDDSASIAIRLPGETRQQSRPAELQSITPAYFSVVDLPILQGRAFTEEELRHTGPDRPAIVSEGTARSLWPSGDPIGRRLLWEDTSLMVVGVVGDAQVSAIGRVDPYYVYVPGGGPTLLAKTRTDLDMTVANIQAAARGIDPNLAILVFPLEVTLGWWRGVSGVVTTLGTGLGVLALVLAAVGVYGVVAYAVTRRHREIGIRLALGARTVDVLVLIFRQTMRPVLVGAGIGMAGAVALSQVLSVVLFGVSPADPAGLGGAALLVLGIALLAGLIAARPATRADATAALRT